MSNTGYLIARARRIAPWALVAALWLTSSPASAQTLPLAQNATASESHGSEPSDDPQLRQDLAAIRDKYQQDRQALRTRAADLPPEERIRLHRELLEAHQSAIAKAEAEARNRSGGSRERWEERRDQRFERLREVRKDGSGHKRR